MFNRPTHQIACLLLLLFCAFLLVVGNPPAARAGALGGYFGGTDSQADKPAAPQTAPQAAPQASPQAATATACRQMLIHLSDYYGPVQRVKLNQAAGDIKQIYWFKQQNAQRLRIIYRNNQRQEVRLMSNPHSIRGLSFWCQGNQLCPKVPGLENQDFVLNFQAQFNNQPTHLACSTYKRGGYPGKVLFNNFNGNGVQNNPTRKTVFRLNGRCAITEVHTFHHNQYQGRAPGKIFIRGVNGTRGSWAFKARPGLSSWPTYYLPNCNWIVNPPNLTIGPGTYEITVSDQASWSHNRGSGNAGYAIVWGRCSTAPRPTTTTTLPPSTTTTQPPTPGNTLPPSTTTTLPPIPSITLPPTPPTTLPPATTTTLPPAPATDISETQPTASMGDWNWFTGGRVRLAEDGQVYVYDQNKGKWMASQGSHWRWKDRSRGVLEVSWNNNSFIDTLTLSQDGNRLDGANQNGSRVWATRSQAPATTTSTTTTSTTTTTLPPTPATTSDSWVSWRGHRYLVITTDTDWNTARREAQRMGGYLVCIDDAQENEFVRDLVRQHTPSQTYWIGFSDKGSEGRWWWVNGQPAGYTNWHSGEPNNAHGNENCTEVGWHSFYSWNDADCGSRMPYVVEMDR